MIDLTKLDDALRRIMTISAENLPNFEVASRGSVYRIDAAAPSIRGANDTQKNIVSAFVESGVDSRLDTTPAHSGVLTLCKSYK